MENLHDWVNCYIFPSDIWFDIPEGDNIFERTEILQITLDKDAPAFQSFSISVNAFCDRSGFVKQSSNKVDMNFTVGLLPFFSIEVDNATIDIVSGEETSIPIKITNKGNGLQLIEGTILEHLEDYYNLSLEPHQVYIDVNESKNMTLKIQTKYFYLIYIRDYINFLFCSLNPYTGKNYYCSNFNIVLIIHS